MINSIKTLFGIISAFFIAANALAELKPMDESEMANHAGQAGLSIELKHLRINAHESGSIDDPTTVEDESDGRTTTGYHYDYVTEDHNGDNETHYFTNEVSLALDTEGAITLDITERGALVIGLPDRMNYVGDGHSMKGIYLNGTGNPADGGQLMLEKNTIGNFNTGGSITMWGSD
jgi:hypothetical protein